ncbi:putative MO25-like protein [Iris pallida]|uniref:MO25-like protein n=1 Tax=Iris pallida TaxID=29817 RepID=A0AAX6F5U3_IRIPA|nr:putative MO25-like protein [Iris pallida]KAJ6811787.1 putative MO25-like protein [Iris pallida]
MKGLFKSKPKTPAELVRQMRDLLILFDAIAAGGNGSPSSSSSSPSPFLKESKREEKMAELSKLIRELKDILYGKAEQEPVTDACMQLTREMFKENTLRLLILSLPKLNLEARKDATQVVANLQRQYVNATIVASEYLEENKDLLDILVSGYDDMDLALHYGFMLRECIRHQSIAKYVLESELLKKFFNYIPLPEFEIASDAASTFKELLTRHKSTVAEFLSKNYDWFFAEYNEKLLKSESYLARRQGLEILGAMLLDRSNSAIMVRYVSSKDNLQPIMDLLRELRKKNIQIEAFHVFKLFAANKNKPPEIATILMQNKEKLLRFFSDFKIEKEDEKFEADLAEVVKVIESL